MAISQVSDLNSLFNTIHEDSLFVSREQNVMVQLVHRYSATGWMNRVVPTRPLVTAQAVAEGVDFANPTTFNKTAKATLTPGEVMAQVVLTDRQIDTDPEDARRSAAQELGNAMATKIDVDLCADFASFTNAKGTAGGTASIAYYAAAISVLRNGKAMNPISVVLHPYQWHRVWTELGSPASNKAFLGDTANEAMRAFFVGEMLAARWITSANIAVNGSDDAVSGVFHADALGFDERKTPVLEPERDASLRAWELNESAGYAHGVVRSEWGCKVTSDASEPS